MGDGRLAYLEKTADNTQDNNSSDGNNNTKMNQKQNKKLVIFDTWAPNFFFRNI